MTKDEAIAEIEKYQNLCLRAYVALDKVKESTEERLLKVANTPLALIDMFVRGVPLLSIGIREVREEQGYSLADMEKRTGIDAKTLDSYERGKTYYIPYDDAEKIRKALHCSSSYIVEKCKKEEERRWACVNKSRR